MHLVRGLLLLALCGAGCGGASSKGSRPPTDNDEARSGEAPGKQAEDGPPSDADESGDPEAASAAAEPVEDDKARKARLQDCARLIRASNHEQRFLREASKRLVSNDPASLEALADALEDSGRRIGSVSVRDPELSRLRGEYKSMFVGQASACRAVAQAIEAKDDAKARAGQAALAEVAADETRIARAIHARCTPK
jgi:hypothetical protein